MKNNAINLQDKGNDAIFASFKLSTVQNAADKHRLFLYLHIANKVLTIYRAVSEVGKPLRVIVDNHEQHVARFYYVQNHPQMETLSKVFNYNDNAITFSKGDSVMVNATQMAKPFGKRCNDFLSSKQTKELINSLSAKTGISATGLVIVNQGGNNQGTWMHEDLALIFAQWLAPDFYLLCNDRIKELMKTGVATVGNDDEAIAYAMQVLQKRLEQARQEKNMLEQQNNYLTNEIKEQAPKVRCYDEYISSSGTYTATQIAKEYGWGAETLNRKLREMGVQYKQNGQWLLYSKYDGMGYTKSIPRTYTRSDGTTGTQMQTVWTSKGREFIHSIFK